MPYLLYFNVCFNSIETIDPEKDNVRFLVVQKLLTIQFKRLSYWIIEFCLCSIAVTLIVEKIEMEMTSNFVEVISIEGTKCPNESQHIILS